MCMTMRKDVYYCPRCDRTVPKERIKDSAKELSERFGDTSLAQLRCPVCGSEFIDLDKVAPGGVMHVGEKRSKSGIP